jgi:superfamily II DNA or RNA helicase
MACDLICRLSKPTLIVVYQGLPHRAFLRSLRRFTQIPSIGAVGDGHASLGDVVVATVNSCTTHLRDPDSAFGAWMRETVQCVIFDEAHHAASDGSLEVLRNLRQLQHLYAMTATYRRDDERSAWLEAIFGKPTYRITYADNINAGTLTPITVRVREVPKHDFGLQAQAKFWSQTKKAKAYQEVYNKYIIEGITGRNDMIEEDTLREVALGRTVAIIVSRVEHAEILYERLRVHGAEIMVQSGSYRLTPARREELVQNFENRKFPILISTVLDEAVDIPSLDTVVLAGGGKSTVKAEQRVRCSRGCKTLPDGTPYEKKRGYVYVYRDHADWLTFHYTNVKNTLLALTTQHHENEFYEQHNGKWFRLRAG